MSYGLTQTTTTRTPLAGATGVTGAAATKATEGGTLQLSEETLAVGKRVVNRGTTRIRRFVVETPVEEQVSLHEEHWPSFTLVIAASSSSYSRSCPARRW